MCHSERSPDFRDEVKNLVHIFSTKSFFAVHNLFKTKNYFTQHIVVKYPLKVEKIF